MKTIRVAVCLYGQPRTAEYCSPWIKRSFSFQEGKETRCWGKKKEFDGSIEYPTFSVDYFCDLKEFSTAGNFSGKWETPTSYHGDEYIQNIIDIYKPKKYVVTTKDEEDKINFGNPFYTPMFSSICKTVNLKQQVEIEENKLYDWVFITRYDNIVGPSISSLSDYVQNCGVKPLTVYSCGIFGRMINESMRPGFNDTFFWGDSASIDFITSKMYKAWASNNKFEINHAFNLGPNTFLGAALSDAGLVYEPAYVDFALVRQTADLTTPVFESWYYHKDFWINEMLKLNLPTD